jgi:hypothetical protein
MRPRISRRDAISLSIAAATNATLTSQSAEPLAVAPAKFEVATVKPNNLDQSTYSSEINTGHGRLDGQNATLKRYTTSAYSVSPHQIGSGPDWIDSQHIDIQAKADQPIDADDALNLMLHSVLADRFRLTLHRETRTASTYILEVAKKSPRLEVSQGVQRSDLTVDDVSISTGILRLRGAKTPIEVPVIDHAEMSTPN